MTTPIPDYLKDVMKIGEESLKELFMSDEDFEKLKDSSYNLEEKKDENKDKLSIAYRNIIDLLRKYCDLNEDYYPIIAVWIIGTYFHEGFRSYPYLFLNAMRGSGKSRTIKLITDLSKDGEVQMSMTEAVLFRTNGTLGIDEFEGLGRKGNENLRELLNAAYKKGTKVKRMKQKKTMEGVEQVVEEFDVYRPIVMANIWGMEEVLGDRCISLVLEKSENRSVTDLQELWDMEKMFIETKKILESGVVWCGVVALRKWYVEWNKFVTSEYITTYTTHTTLTTHYYTKVFKRIKSLELDGRSVELCFPLLLTAMQIGEDVYEELHKVIKNYMAEKKEDQFTESRDISFIDFISQEPSDTKWVTIKEITNNFKMFINYEKEDDDWLNTKWVGKALNRLKLRKAHKRLRGGVSVILDIEKAKQKIKMFK